MAENPPGTRSIRDRSSTVLRMAGNIAGFFLQRGYGPVDVLHSSSLAKDIAAASLKLANEIVTQAEANEVSSLPGAPLHAG